jgi:hypothetical protein
MGDAMGESRDAASEPKGPRSDALDAAQGEASKQASKASKASKQKGSGSICTGRLGYDVGKGRQICAQ